MAILKYTLTLVHQELNHRALQGTLRKLESRLRNMGYSVGAASLFVAPPPYPGETDPSVTVQEPASSPAPEADVAQAEPDAEQEGPPEALEQEADEDESVGSETEDEDVEEEQAVELKIRFGSTAASRLSDELNLTVGDFSVFSPGGVKGFTVGDVREIAAAKG